MLLHPILTIAIPTYNRSILLERTLKSIVNQNDNRLEILISDNDSTDNTDEIVQNYIIANDNVNYIKNKENIGPDNNFLQCYKKARGKYVLLLGSDDIIHENMISKVIDFLETNQPDLTFLNFDTFKNNGCVDKKFSKSFISTYENIVTNDKSVFMRYAKDKITFMSVSIILRELVLQVENPEKYNGSSFLHTCLMLEATKGGNHRFGIIGTPVISEDISPQNQGTGGNAFLVFGTRMKRVFCELAPKFGYEKRQMSRIYRDYACSTWPRSIASRKAKGIWLKENFKNYGFPSIKMYLKAWVTIVPCLLIPSFVYRVLFKFLKKERS